MIFRLTAVVLFSLMYTVSKSQSTFYKGEKDGWEANYLFDSTGIYFTAVKCNSITTVSFGRYLRKQNKIICKRQSFDSLPPFSSIVQKSNHSDSIVKITFLARYRKLIENKEFVVDAINLSGRTFKRLKVDIEGAVFINSTHYSSIRINYLDHFYAKWVILPVKKEDLTVELSLPKEFIPLRHPNFDMRSGFTFVLKQNSLFDMNGKKLADQVN